MLFENLTDSGPFYKSRSSFSPPTLLSVLPTVGVQRQPSKKAPPSAPPLSIDAIWLLRHQTGGVHKQSHHTHGEGAFPGSPAETVFNPFSFSQGSSFSAFHPVSH